MNKGMATAGLMFLALLAALAMRITLIGSLSSFVMYKLLGTYKGFHTAAINLLFFSLFFWFIYTVTFIVSYNREPIPDQKNAVLKLYFWLLLNSLSKL